MKYIKYILKIPLKIFVQIIGIFVLIPITYKYPLGQFPHWARWWDDYRGRWLQDYFIFERAETCRNLFGEEHCHMFAKANTSWWGAYKWAAFRNACNYFQHEPLGDKSYKYTNIFQKQGEVALVFGYRLKYHLGYKYFNYRHNAHMEELGIPLQWVCSIGLRSSK